ncbi:MAG: hypothetical protein N3F05_00290 [Candidatus Diapherotrites archaeon]|nr:hypothetical protein [Candidatus Diapherotrites archaeon]
MGKVFVATLGMGKGTWGHVGRIIQESDWDKIVLIGTDFAKENFKPQKQCDWILINPRSGFESLKEQIKDRLPEDELCISLISGTGREHSALLSAIKEAGKSFKIVVLTRDGLKEY